MPHSKPGAHEVDHLKGSGSEMLHCAGGGHELEIFVRGAHEVGGQSSKQKNLYLTCIGCVGWQGTLEKEAKTIIKGCWGRDLMHGSKEKGSTRVLTPHGTLVDVFMSDPADPSIKIRRQRLELYLRWTGFYHAFLIKRFEYDNSLISTFVERWRPETHTFHLPWGECTITLEDVVMKLGLPVDGQPVSGTLRSWSKFHQRDIWEWCHELLSEVPAGHVGTTKFNIKLRWLRNRLQQMPLDLEDNSLIQYARCYILYLLGGVLLPDKANNTVHVRYLPLLADYDAIRTYSWGSAVLCWLYRAMYLATDYNVEGMAGCHTLLMSWIYYKLPFWAPNVMTPYSFPLATSYVMILLTLWVGKKGQNDYVEQCLLRHHLRLDNLQVDEVVVLDPQILSKVPAKFFGHPHGDFYTAVVPLIFFRWIDILNVDRVLHQFGGKQRPPNPPINIDTFHRQLACNDDGWWPVQLSAWFEVWANHRTEAYRLRIDHADTLHPSQNYYRWYCNRTRRFLSAPKALHDPQVDVVLAGATYIVSIMYYFSCFH
ncbi:Serine/threonine protein phosphatase 7 long form isogeny [Arachis hypogaea]|nr:Serine/threonine protein phosphatase 7 long form isogeny [Arachis hypogaea]